MDKQSKKVLFTATVDSHILHFHIPYLKMFKDKGYEVHVATNGQEEIPYCDVKHVVTFERNPFSMNNLKAIKQLKKIIEQEKFELIHCHTPMGSVVTRLAAKHSRKAYGTRVIYTAHGFHFYKGASIKNWMLFYPVEKLLSYITDDLITINNEDYELAKKKMKAKRIHYVPGVGIDPEKFNFEMTEEEKEKLRKEVGVSKDDFVMIYPAELTKRKNQGMLIQALAELKEESPRYKLLLPGQDSMNGYYQQMAKDLGVEDCVKFLGYRKDISKLFKISNIAVSAAVQEGLPVNIMEAQMCGLPCVVTNCRGNRDLVQDGVNGYVVEIDEKEKFKEKILEVRKEKNDSRLFENFLLDNVVKIYSTIYENALKKEILFLRSTSVVNDSRACKEIEFYIENNCNVTVVGWNRQLLTVSDKKNLKYIMYSEKGEYGAGFRNIFKMIKFEKFIYKIVKKYRNDMDLIHSCDFDTAYVALKSYNKSRTKFVYDIYDYYVDCHNLGKLKKYIEKKDVYLINKADLVIICNEKRKQQIAKTNPKDILVIHNSPEIRKMETIMSMDKNCIKICYVGILQDNRLLKEICDKIIDIKNIELHIGGFGKYEKYFEDMSNIHKNIKFYGSMEYEQVLDLENRCDILFATYNPKIENHKYSAPNKVYEAMALGKPIIVCKDTGVDEMVLEEHIGYVIDYSATEFINVVENISKVEYEKISNNEKELYLKKYSWNKMKSLLKEKII